MRSTFPLFNTPIDLAHNLWKNLLQDGDGVIDATCGNGKDSLVLSKLLQEKKETHLVCMDIQQEALNNTKLLLEKTFPTFLPFTEFHLGSHEKLHTPKTGKIKLIVYNLGYLPGGNKSLTTRVSSTLASIKDGLGILSSGGLISITCYPGHEEGAREESALIDFLSSLDPKDWSASYFQFQNRKTSPSLLLIQKRVDSSF